MGLTELQDKALKSMKSGKNVFITGAGGTGKTFLLNEFIKWTKNSFNFDDEHAVAVTSTTGSSATLINGITLHSWAGVEKGTDCVDFYYHKINKNYFHKKKWKKVKVLIIDEISMLTPILFERLDTLGKRLRKDNKPFGGIQIILSGDFCQLPTVEGDEYCFEAFNWGEVVNETFYLKDVLRQDDTKFLNCLNEIRLGDISDYTKKILNSRITSKIIKRNGIMPTVLYSKRKKVNEYNESKLNELIKNGSESYVYDSKYEYGKDISNDMKKFLKNHIDKNNNVKVSQQLAVGAQVMVTANLSSMKLVNGSRGVIVSFEDKIPIVRFLNGVEKKLDYNKWELDLGGESKVMKTQIPLTLAWAMTIHKSQGMTMDYVYTDVGSSIFEYGQTYVVLSRIKDLDGLCLKDIDFDKIMVHPNVKKYYTGLR